jgi:hypothetical protein
MFKQLLLTAVLLGAFVYGEASAQEATAKERIPLGTKNVSEKALREQPDKGKKSLNETLKEHEISIQVYNFFTSLGETRGKVPVYSTMEGKLQVEIGVFGYLGIKWQF